MIYESDLIKCLLKHLDKESIKVIISDLELEWDDELIEIFADNGLLNLAFELCDPDDIVEFLSSGEIDTQDYLKRYGIPTSMNLSNVLEKVNNGATIYNIFYNLGVDIEESSYECARYCFSLYSDIKEEIMEFLGGKDTVIRLLDTYGHLNGWYKGDDEFYYRNKYEVENTFNDMHAHTINEIGDFLSVSPTEIQKFLKDKLNEDFELDERLYTDAYLAIELEYGDIYKL